MLLYPVLVAMTALLALAIGIWMSALNAKYRDVRHALPFVIQLWMFSTPIIYPLSLVPDEWKWLIRLNPMTGIVEGFRSCLIGRDINWLSLGLSALIIVIALICFTYVFRRMEDYFADFI
jgi:lipopolysaccharide transport system permease protein